MSVPLTFGELSKGEKFVDFPRDGDDSGHGGYRRGVYVFIKTGDSTAVRIDIGNESTFPETMQVYKIIF